MRDRYLLIGAAVLLLSAAFILRARAVTFGFPLFTHPDESFLIDPALHIVDSGDLNPHGFFYPYLPIYLLSLVYAVLKAAGASSPGDGPSLLLALHYWGRLLTVSMSSAALLLVFAAALRLFGAAAAVSALALLVFMPLHVANSFVITTDVPMSMWVSAAFILSVLTLLRGPNLRRHLLNGLLIGLAAGTKYNAIFAVAPMLLAHAAHKGIAPRHFVRGGILPGLALIPLVFLATTPYAVLDYRSFVTFLASHQMHFSLGHPGAESQGSSYLFYLATVFHAFGAPVSLLALSGLLILLRRDPWKAALILSFPLLYVAFMGRYPVRFDRFLVPVLPFVALLAVAPLQALSGIERKALRSLVAAGLCLVVAASSMADFGSSWRLVEQQRLPDTRWLAKQWIEDNIPAGARIAREHYTPPLDEDRFQVANLGYFGLLRLDDPGAFDYLVSGGGDFARFLNNPGRYPVEAARYKKIFSSHELLRSFAPEVGKSSGPIVLIYKTR